MNNTSHDQVRDAHGDTTEDGKLAATHLVKVQKGGDTGHELANVDHTTENESHFVALTKSGKEDGCIVHKSVNAYI